MSPMVPRTVEAQPGRAELKGEFVEMRAKGLSLSKITKRLGRAKQTVCNWNTELEEWSYQKAHESSPTRWPGKALCVRALAVLCLFQAAHYGNCYMLGDR